MTGQFARRSYKQPSAAEWELRRFVYEFDPREVILPKDIDPVDVASFIQDQLHQLRLSPTAADQLVELADFYDLKNLTPSLLARLDKREDSNEKYLTAIALTRGVGILGKDEQLRAGLDYLLYLSGLRYASASVAELLSCYSEYSLTSPAGFRAPIERILSQLRNDAKSTPSLETRMRAVEDLYNNTVSRIEAATETKKQIVSENESTARLDALVDVYLNLNPRYREWMERWAVRELLREFESSGKPALTAAFRRGLGRVQTSATSEDTLAGPRAVCLRSIEFFGGRLSAEEFAQSRTVSAHIVGLLTLE
jgi:hypothetical protein